MVLFRLLEGQGYSYTNHSKGEEKVVNLEERIALNPFILLVFIFLSLDCVMSYCISYSAVMKS